MKIIFSDNSLKELLNFRGDIINHFLKNGHEVIILAPNNLENPIEKYPFFDKVSYIPLKLDSVGNNPLKDIKYFLNLLYLYKKNKPDYIFHYTIKPNIYGSIAAKLLNIKSTAMVAGLGSCFSNYSLGDKIARALYKLGLRFSDKILVLNEYNYSFLKNNNFVNQDKLILLPGGEGVNIENFS
ncbi:MAG: hypothetical protein J1F12_08955 [Muribaculaceae bacterium]|nr:hypothetical protein [Muribaculaceae bacterium]